MLEPLVEAVHGSKDSAQLPPEGLVTWKAYVQSFYSQGLEYSCPAILSQLIFERESPLQALCTACT